MKKVITYGTYDLLHEGHIRLLQRAKALGDYLIVGVTSDDYDKTRGKINVTQSLVERIKAVRNTGLADLIIVEEYDGQKIDDIKKYNVDIFTLGSDWEGKFDYLNEYCEVIYLPRTEGISSSEIRSQILNIKLGIVGDYANYINKFYEESKYVNGIDIVGICTNNIDNFSKDVKKLSIITTNYDELLENIDAVYIRSKQKEHYNYIKKALENGKNVLCESPIDISKKRCEELFSIAKKNNCILMEAIRTAYSTAYSRLLLLLKSGKIGDIISIDVTCTSMKNVLEYNSLLDWGGNALLPIFQILGTNYCSKNIISKYYNRSNKNDLYTQILFLYNNAVANLKVAEGSKSDNCLIVMGTKGYAYVPSPWWKTDYFELRYENSDNNKRYFYQLDGEGIRYELVSFIKNINEKDNTNLLIDKEVSLGISKIMEDYINDIDIYDI